jgi:hypothetical protein
MSVTRVQLVGNVSTGASFVGVVTATSFSGSGANLTGIAATDNVRTSSLVVSGVSTLGTVVVGGATTQLIVVGDARVTGILTIGTGSITLNGSTNIINVGTGLTLSSSGIVAGVITATSFVGSGSGLTGIANTANIRSDTITVGVLTATRLDVPPAPITFSPSIGATNVALASNIIITFDQQVYKGTGNITLRSGSAGGTAFSTIGVSSSSVTISGGTVTIDPPANIGSGVTTFVVVDAGAFSGLTTTSVNNIINTYSFTAITFAFSSINPGAGATNIGVGTNITLTFTSPPPIGTGTITLRSGSTSGSVIETFNVSTSSSITVSGNDFIINPTNNLGFSTSIHTIIPSTAITNYVGLNTAGADTHSFTTLALNLGESHEGGFLICKASPVRWIVSPYSAEVSRCGDLTDDANTRAQQVSGCTGWFVPTCVQSQNPGYCCRSFWGPSPCYSTSSFYWISTIGPCGRGSLQMANGAFTGNSGHCCSPALTFCARAFRCVTY